MFQYTGNCPAPNSDAWNFAEDAQQIVADAMAKTANELESAPLAVINVGDNFYYGGIGVSPEGDHCNLWECMTKDYAFNTTWRDVYMSNKNDKAGRLQVPWLSVLGNHDYGGAGGLADWSAQVEFTHLDPLNVWKMPFQYFKQRVQADGFFIDIFMNDVNMGDCCETDDHGICHQKLVAGGARRGDEGKCRTWMSSVSDANLKWLDNALRDSNMDGARWKIVVGHFVEGGTDV